MRRRRRRMPACGMSSPRQLPRTLQARSQLEGSRVRTADSPEQRPSSPPEELPKRASEKRARRLAKTGPRVQGTRMQIAYCPPSPCGGSAIFSTAETMLPVLDRRNFPAGPRRAPLMPPIAASRCEGGRVSSTAATARAGASTLAVPAEVSPPLACLKLLRAVPGLMCQVSARIGPHLRQCLRLPAIKNHNSVCYINRKRSETQKADGQE